MNLSSSSKYIVIEDGSMSVNLKSGGIRVTTEALQTLKLIGCTYGLYSSYEDMNDYRVMYQEEPHPMLIVQNNTSYHGSPYWETIEVLTQNPQEVEAYLKFKRLVKSNKQKEIEDEKIA